MSNFADWVPPCPVKEASDEDIKAAPFYSRVRDPLGVGRPTLPHESALPIARDTWQMIREAVEQEKYSAGIIAVFDLLIANDVEHNCEVTITLTGEKDGDEDLRIGRYKVSRSGRAKNRFKHADYASLIGYGEEADSELGKLGREGGFVTRKTAMKNPAKNGTYEFVISEGDAANKVCSEFRCELFQYTDDGVKHPTIVFPPASGDKKKLRADDDVLEVPSMSKILPASVLNGAQTPAVVFQLAERLALLNDDDASDDASETDDDTPETGDAPNSQAAALLAADDDGE